MANRKRQKPRRKAYMDRNGTLTKERNDSAKIRRAERWVREILALGATIPEAMWEIKAIFDVAFDNVRFERIKDESD